MPDYRLTLTLNEPFTCSSKPVISNEIQTLDFIPATVLRGALAASLSYAGRQRELSAWFGTSGPRWTNAIPVPSRGYIVPMPLCFVADKKDNPFRGRYYTLNTLLLKLPSDASKYLERTGHRLDEPHQFQWAGVRKPWLCVEDGKPVEARSLQLDSSMHVGLHYGRQSARDGALYSRREIPAGTRFEAWVRDPRGVISDIPDFLFLGKRRSAGAGAATLACEPKSPTWANPPRLAPGQTEVTVQLMADAIVPDPSTGNYLRGLDAKFWSRTLGLTVTLDAQASANRTVLGWSTVWDLPRTQALAIAAGSVYRLKAGDTPALEAAVAQLALNGIGIRRHEGFGVLAIDPPWLDYPINGQIVNEPETAVDCDATALPWPGLEDEPAAKIRTIADKARDIAPGLRDVEAQLGALSAYACRVQRTEDVKTFAASYAQRVNPRGWEKLTPALAPLLELADNIRQTRFALDALETYLKD